MDDCVIVSCIVSSIDSRTSCPVIPHYIDDSTDPDVVDEKPSYRGSDVQPTNYSNVNKQLSTQDDVIVNVHENTAYTNEDHNSVLCDKEFCGGTIKSFSCTRCEMSFTSLEELTSHCETHKTAATHKCHVCEKSLTSKGNLTKHLRIHSGERPFKCDVCDKSFTQKYTLKAHYLRIHRSILHCETHKTAATHKCDVCEKSFTQKSSFTRHLRIHSGERPFKCDICDKSFTQKPSLKSHYQRIHSGE